MQRSARVAAQPKTFRLARCRARAARARVRCRARHGAQMLTTMTTTMHCYWSTTTARKRRRARNAVADHIRHRLGASVRRATHIATTPIRRYCRCLFCTNNDCNERATIASAPTTAVSLRLGSTKRVKSASAKTVQVELRHHQQCHSAIERDERRRYGRRRSDGRR